MWVKVLEQKKKRLLGKTQVMVENSVAKQKRKYVRTKHKCPFPSCKSVVLHLPRHMRLSHGWLKADARGVLNKFGLRKDRFKSLKSKQRLQTYMCPVPKCQSVVKRIHNHLSDVHKIKPGTAEYKKLLASVIVHDVIVISSESSISDDSDSYDDEEWKKLIKREQKRSLEYPSLVKQVYPSDEEEASCSDGDVKQRRKVCKKQKKIVSQRHPSTFKNDTEDGEEDEDEYYMYDCAYQQIEVESTEMPLEDQPSTSLLLNTRSVSSDEQGDSSSTDSSSQEYLHSDDECDPTNHPDKLDSMSNSIFANFELWLKGPDGGRKDDRCASQCARQVQSVVQTIDPDNSKLINILHKRTLRDEWLVKFEKNHQPGTVKSYLGALHRFYAFLKCERIMLPGVDDAPEVLASLCEQMKMWSKSYGKLVKSRFWEKRMQDIACLRTPEQIRQFDNSNIAREAIKVLGEFQESPENTMPTKKQYTIVRDYLLTVICINNGSRSGALANMTLGEFRAAQKHEDYVVNVKNHKTFTSHGPAHVVCSPSIYQWIKIFVLKFREQLGEVDTTNTAPVFLTWNQRKMHSSHIGAQIDSCWGKVFGKEASSGGATAFRKAVVSAVQESQEEIHDDLANLMVHNKATADRYYVLQSKTKSAVKASRQVSKIMHSSQRDESSKDWQSSRHRWSFEEEATLKNLFAEHIENHTISFDAIKEIAKKDPLLSVLPCIVIRNKIKSLFKDQDQTVDLPDEVESPKERFTRFGLLPGNGQATQGKQNEKEKNSSSEHTPSVISPSMMTSTTRKNTLLNEEETAAFQALFKDLIHSRKPIKKDYVISQIEKNPTLKHLLTKCSPLQLADKVRTERKIAERHFA